MAAEPGITIAFANMDWKQERHDGKHWKRHHALWRQTTAAMLRNFEADVLCFCEVGVVGTPVSEEHFSALKNLTSEVWVSFGIAEEFINYLHTPGQPYLTAYRTDRATCQQYSMLTHLFDADGPARTAQHFLLKPTMSSDAGINIILRRSAAVD